MLQKYHAIVLRVVKYNDTTRIADLLTEEQGRFSVAIPATSHGKKGTGRAIWQPLAMIELQADLQRSKGLPRPREVNLAYNYSDLPYNPVKTMVALFIDELLCNALWGEVPDSRVFRFVEQSLVCLDATAGSCANFPIAFAVQFLRFVGLSPNTTHDSRQHYYDLVAAEYADGIPLHNDFLQHQEADAVALFARMNYRNMHRFRLNALQRQRVLDIINTYYSIHIPNFKSLKSLSIFHEALS